MENQPIIFGRDVNTNAITQIKTLGNVLFTNSGTLNDLSDVVITSPTDNQILKYSSPNWINGSLSLSNLGNVVLTSPATGQSLTYDGTNWTNQNKDYLLVNMYGTTVPGVYSTSTEKYPLVCTSTYWSSIPNPNNGTQGSVSSLRSNVYTTGTGIITLDSNRKYILRASMNLGGQNLNASTNAEIRLKRWTGTGTNFTNFTPDFFNQTTMIIDFTGASLEVIGYASNCPGFTITFRLLTPSGTGLAGYDTSITVMATEI